MTVTETDCKFARISKQEISSSQKIGGFQCPAVQVYVLVCRDRKCMNAGLRMKSPGDPGTVTPVLSGRPVSINIINNINPGPRYRTTC